MIRSQNTVYFNIMVNGTFVDSWSGPSGDTYAMYIMAHNPSGKNFNRLEFSVYDINTGGYYDRVKNSPVTQQMNIVDMALEKYYYHDGNDNEYPPTTVVWKWIYNFHVYDYNIQRFDLLHNGYVSEVYTPDYVNNVVGNYDYADFTTYFDVPNAQATLYMTRYNAANSPPPHP
jgi:hypothetical protein